MLVVCSLVHRALERVFLMGAMEFIVTCVAAILAVIYLISKVASNRCPPFIESFRQKHVFITGGSSGIGLAIAKEALLQGAFVTIVSRSSANLLKAVERLVKEARCAPDRIRYQVADVSDHEAISTAVKEALEWKPIDVLVCNAGLTRGGFLENTTVEDINLTVRTNLFGAIYPLHAALPVLKEHSFKHPTSIVIVSSIASMYLLFGHSVYTASKYALRGLAEGLRFELLPYNIKVSLICPGFVKTPFLDDAEKDEHIRELMKTVNLYDRKQAEAPEEVAIYTLEAIKEGIFLVTNKNEVSSYLMTLCRGAMSMDSYGRTLLEAFCFLPVRLVNLKAMADIRRTVIKFGQKH